MKTSIYLTEITIDKMTNIWSTVINRLKDNNANNVKDLNFKHKEEL